MHASWAGLPSREVQILAALAKTVAVVALQRLAISRLVINGVPGFNFHSHTSFVRNPNCEGAWYRHQKLGQLVHFVEATAFEGNPQSFLMCIEGFVKEDHQRWLKVAAGPKAQVVDMATSGLSLQLNEVAVEMGCFVGYTAIRLGWRLFHPRVLGTLCCASVVSTELEAVHVCIARHHIDGARLSNLVEVWPGHIPWTTPRYTEQFGSFCVGFMFMDHKGTRFHIDVDDCKSMQAFAPRSRLLCDNVLKPGSPVHLWKHHRLNHHPDAVVWSLHEFHEPDVEDWQAIHDGVIGCTSSWSC